MAPVTLDGVRKVYPNGYAAVHGIDLEIKDGELMILVGPSGCGKTSILRMVAGLETITAGTLRIGDRVVNNVAPKERDIAMVFQNYALYPHMTVAQNIGFALRLRKMAKSDRRAKVNEVASVLDLTGQIDMKPGQLSGGQRQRVAMGRAIVREPAVFLMDEPLSNLDAKLRTYMRAEVMRIQRRIGVATLYVTHDQVEAMTMGDRVAVLRDGHLQQCDVPQALYDNPANLFVAAFIGSPSMNLYQAHLSSDGKILEIGDQRLALHGSSNARVPATHVGQKVVVGMRPESLKLVSVASDADPQLVADVELVEALGSEQLVHFRIDASRVRVEEAEGVGGDAVLETGETSLAGRGEGVARVEPGVQIRTGDRVTFTVDVSHLHYFDPTSGVAIRY